MRSSALLFAAALALVALGACKKHPPHPSVSADVMGTTVNGARVTSLESALRDEPKGPIDVTISPDVEAAPGVEIVRTVARAGFSRMNVHAGRTSAVLTWYGGEPREVLHVERDAVTNGFVLRFEGGRRMTVNDRAAAAEMIAAYLPPSRDSRKRALVLRIPNGTFREALELADWFGRQPELVDAAVALEVGPPSRD